MSDLPQKHGVGNIAVVLKEHKYFFLYKL